MELNLKNYRKAFLPGHQDARLVMAYCNHMETD